MSIARAIMVALVPATWFSTFAISAPITAQHYEHGPSGLLLDVPAPFAIVRPRRDANYDTIVDVESRTGIPPLAGTSRAVCSVGFSKAPPGSEGGRTDVNAEQAIGARLDETKKVMTRLGNVLERIDVFEEGGVKGIELVMVPGKGPDAASTRQFLAFVEQPTGRITTACATRADAMPAALEAFHTIRNGAKLMQR